jgi:Tol biopolymer transport system component
MRSSRWWRLLYAVSLAGLVSCGRIGVELLPIDGWDAATHDGGTEAAPDEDAGDAAPDELDADLPDVSDMPEADVTEALDGEATSPGLDGSLTDARTIGADAGPMDADYADAAVSCMGSDFGEPELLTGFALSGTLWAPALSSDGVTLYFAEETDTDERIMMATRSDRGAIFSAAVEVPGVQSSAPDGAPLLSQDGLSLYIFSERAGSLGARDLWLAQRAAAIGPFDTPIHLLALNTIANDHLPRLSPNGLTLSFSSNRGGGVGESDIWFAQRSRPDLPFGQPTNWTELNTSSSDASATLSSDGLTVVLSSERPGGLGAKDLWIATRPHASAAFPTPTNLTVANSTGSELDCMFSPDDRELLFSSARDGSRKLWRVVRTCR